MSGGLTPCRQLGPSSRREHVNALNSETLIIKKIQQQSNIQTTHKSLYSAAAFKNSKITSGLTVLKRSCKEGTW